MRGYPSFSQVSLRMTGLSQLPAELSVHEAPLEHRPPGGTSTWGPIRASSSWRGIVDVFQDSILRGLRFPPLPSLWTGTQGYSLNQAILPPSSCYHASSSSSGILETLTFPCPALSSSPAQRLQSSLPCPWRPLDLRGARPLLLFAA